MTVTSSRSFHYNERPADVRAAISRVIETNPRYILLGSGDDTWHVQHRPKTWPLTLSTGVELILVPDETNGSVLHLGTRSQALIAGDVLGMYPRLMDNLGRAVSEALL